MYGLVNQGVQDLVLQLGGEELWATIKQRAGVDFETFVGMDVYPDEITVRLVHAVSDTLGITPGEVLRAFGRHWILYTGRKGYGAMFETMGRSLPEFLGNLDAMHARLSLSMPHLEPPSFVCEQTGPNHLRLEYYSHRRGLAPMVVGLIDGLGEVFGLTVRTNQILDADDGADHDEFTIDFDPVMEPADAR